RRATLLVQIGSAIESESSWLLVPSKQRLICRVLQQGSGASSPCLAAALTALLQAFFSSQFWLRIFVAISDESTGRPVRSKGRAIRTLAGGGLKVWDIPYPPSCVESCRDSQDCLGLSESRRRVRYRTEENAQ